MRLTALVSDIVLFLPLAYNFVHLMVQDPRHRLYSFAAILTSPALNLIDHGHFQYILSSKYRAHLD